MKLIKMLCAKSTPILFALALAVASFTSVAVAAGGGASHAPADPNRLMKDEYHYKETGDTYAFKYALVGIGVAILFTVISIAGGHGRNKS